MEKFRNYLNETRNKKPYVQKMGGPEVMKLDGIVQNMIDLPNYVDLMAKGILSTMYTDIVKNSRRWNIDPKSFNKNDLLKEIIKEIKQRNLERN